jgi:hypothetical protein
MRPVLWFAILTCGAGCGAAVGDPPDALGPRADVGDAGTIRDTGPSDTAIGNEAGPGDLGDTDLGSNPDAAPADTGPDDTGVSPDAGSPTGRGVFLVGGDGKALLTSFDGTNWNTIYSDNGVYEDLIRGVAGGDGVLVAVGGGNNTSQVLVSTDGTNFEARSPGLGDWIGGAAFLGDDLIVVGGNGLRLRSSDQGRNFGDRGGYYEGHFRAVASGGGRVLAVGDTYGSQNVGLSSSTTDGRTWSPVQTGGEKLWAVAYGNGRFVAVGDNGRCTSTTDGAAFEERQCGNAALYQVDFGDGHFVTSNGSTQYTSTDGLSWTPDNVATPYRQAYGDGIWVGVGGDAHRYRSTDGRTFMRTSTQPGPGRWVAFGRVP